MLMMVMVMMVVIVGMIMSTTAAMAVLVVVMMVVVTASAIMVMMVMMGCDPSLKDHIDSGILQCMKDGVPQTILLDIEDGGHEGELRMPAGPDLPMEQDTFPQIGEVHSDGGLVGRDGHLDMTHECSCLALHPSSDIGEDVCQSGLHIRIESRDGTIDTYSDTACFLC